MSDNTQKTDNGGNFSKPKIPSHVTIIEITFFILILFILALIGVAVFMNDDHRFDTDVLAILVGTIALMLSASILIPRFMLKNEVDACVNERKIEIHDYMEKKLDELNDSHKKLLEKYATTTELYRLDAHLSRMIGYSLINQDPIWAIGWLFRTIKRYLRLPIDDFNMYRDFINFVNQEILRARRAITDKIIKEAGERDKTIDVYSEIFSVIVYEKPPVEGDESRRVIRAIKDIVDFLYYLEIQSHTANSPFSHDNFVYIYNSKGKYIETIKLLALILIRNKKEEITVKNLTESVYEISDYNKKNLAAFKDNFNTNGDETDIVKNGLYNDLEKFFTCIHEKSDKALYIEELIHLDNASEPAAIFNDSLKEFEQYKDVVLK
jgi:hypothetical protein